MSLKFSMICLTNCSLGVKATLTHSLPWYLTFELKFDICVKNLLNVPYSANLVCTIWKYVPTWELQSPSCCLKVPRNERSSTLYEAQLPIPIKMRQAAKTELSWKFMVTLETKVRTIDIDIWRNDQNNSKNWKKTKLLFCVLY